MIIRLQTGQPPTVLEADNLTRLHVSCAAVHDDLDLGELARLDDEAAHVWLNIHALRANVPVTARTPGWDDRFDAMIAYAASKDWLDAQGTAVRAHLELDD